MESEMKYNSFTCILISDFYRLTSHQNEPCHYKQKRLDRRTI